jgi:hypothetical protein
VPAPCQPRGPEARGSAPTHRVRALRETCHRGHRAISSAR